jgi:N-formylglutamate amidohydrolase
MPHDTVTAPSYRLSLPQDGAAAAVFSSPHSGADYPAEMLHRSVLDARALRSSEDAFVEHLLAPAPAQGAALIAARLPRAWLDLNRSPDELDPALIEGLRPVARNARVAAGLGVIPRVVSGGRAIYAGRLTRVEAQARIEQHWRPYHDRLQALMDDAHRRCGVAFLFDIHSMPHEALEHFGARKPQVVLGDRHGSSAGREVTAAVEAAFAAEGLRVARNAPFAGAYIAQTYGRPARGRHAVQIELDRALYMDEAAVRPSADFDAFAGLMARVIARLAALGAGDAQRLAAE